MMDGQNLSEAQETGKSIEDLQNGASETLAICRAHFQVAVWYGALSTIVGTLVIVFSAAVGGSAVAGGSLYNAFASSSILPGSWLRPIFAFVAFLAAIAASFQTLFKPANRAEKHRKAAFKYGSLSRSFEAASCSCSTAEECCAKLQQLYSEWTKIEEVAILPVRDWRIRIERRRIGRAKEDTTLMKRLKKYFGKGQGPGAGTSSGKAR